MSVYLRHTSDNSSNQGDEIKSMLGINAKKVGNETEQSEFVLDALLRISRGQL